MSKASIFTDLKLQTRDGLVVDDFTVIPALYQVRDAATVLLSVRHLIGNPDQVQLGPVLAAIIDMLIAAGEDLEVIAEREAMKS